MKFTGMLTAAMAAMALAGQASEYYVAPGGSDGNGGTGWTDALATIGAGVAKGPGQVRTRCTSRTGLTGSRRKSR